MSKECCANWFLIDEKVRFLVLAMTNMFIRYVLFVILGALFSVLHYQAVLVLTWALSSVVAFLSYKVLVFRTEGNHLKEYGKSLLIWCLSYFVNALILWLLVEKFLWNVYVAQGVAILFLAVVNYLLFKHFAFKQPRKRTLLERLYNLWE